jgi:hypothetical protein
MPSMPLEAPAALEPPLMRCLAAHPVHQAAHQRQRDATGQPQAYFLSPALVAELLPWVLDRALLTPQAADQLHRTVQLAAHTDPAACVPIAMRPAGGPLGLQPTVLASDLFRWLFCQDPDPTTADCPIPMAQAIQVVEGLQQDPAHAPRMGTRAQVLLDWLRAQPA